MIKEYFYSTLTEELFEDRSLAEKAEDEFVANYFKDLDKRAEQKRRMKYTETHKIPTTSINIPISKNLL